MPKKILVVFGTRPEAIKMAPLVHKLLENSEHLETIVCVTGQHREMLDQVLNLFEIVPDFDLRIMQDNQDLSDISSLVLLGMRDILDKTKPDLVIVHGDTTTSTFASLAAFYKKISVAHVEAGLRTHNKYSPWPEEINRQITSRIASFHFAHTIQSKINLINEDIDEAKIIVTGNTVIDALQWVSNKLKEDNKTFNSTKKVLLLFGYDIDRLTNNRKLILITGHRRENFGEGFFNICKAIKFLAAKFKDVDFVYPMHLNPNIRKPVLEMLGNKSDNIFLLEPLEYLPFVYLMGMAYIILTDSGGIQEEAPGLGTPVLVMRDTTERPEALDAGTVKLVGTSKDLIIKTVTDLLQNNENYKKMSNAKNPFGDGNAAELITDFLVNNL